MVDAGVARHETYPKKVRFTTYTMIYHNMDWVHVLGMDKEWERAELNAEHKAAGSYEVTTKNISAFQLVAPGGEGNEPLHEVGDRRPEAAGVHPPAQPVQGSLFFAKADGKWHYVADRAIARPWIRGTWTADPSIDSSSVIGRALPTQTGYSVLSP